MISVNNLDYIKIFFQKTTNTLLVSLGEIHSLEKCSNSLVSIDLPVMINNLVGNVPKNKVVLLIEAQATGEWVNSAEINNIYKHPKKYSKLYETCFMLNSIDSIYHKYFIDPRRFPCLSSLMDFYAIYEKNNYTLVDFVFLRENYAKLYQQIESFLFYNFSNVGIQKYFSEDCYLALNSIARVNKVFMEFQEQHKNNGTLVPLKSISSLVDELKNSIFKLWINMQDFFAVTRIQDNLLNIMYTGVSHNLNFEEKILTSANGWEVLQEGNWIGRNCVSVNFAMMKYIVDEYDRNWNNNICKYTGGGRNNLSDHEMELSNDQMEFANCEMGSSDCEMGGSDCEMGSSDCEMGGSDCEMGSFGGENAMELVFAE